MLDLLGFFAFAPLCAAGSYRLVNGFLYYLKNTLRSKRHSTKGLPRVP